MTADLLPNEQGGSDIGPAELHQSRPLVARWPAVFSLTLGVFGLVMGEFLPLSLLTPMASDLGVTVGAAGQSVSVTAILAAIAGPAVVITTHRIDRRWTLAAMTALLVGSSILAAVAQNLAVLLTARVLLGIGLGGFWAMAGAVATRLVPPRSVARAMALVLSGISVATVCAAPLGAYIGATSGWRSAFLLAAVVGGVALTTQLLTLPKLPPAGRAGMGGMKAALSVHRVRIALFAAFMLVIGQYGSFTYIRPFLERISGMAVGQISLTLLAYGIAGFFGSIAGGAITGRNPKKCLIWAGALTAAATAMPIIGASSAAFAMLSVGLWGFAFGAIPVGTQALVVTAAGEEAEHAGALLSTTFQMAIALGAVLGGVLIGVTGPVGVMFFVIFTSLIGIAVVAVAGVARRDDAE